MNTTNPNDSNNTFSKNPVKNFVIGFFVILIFLIGHSLFAQVGVGTTNPQAALDIEASSTGSPSSNDGLLIPRVTNMPPAPGATRDGMMVFYTGTGYDGKGYYYWDNPTTSWIKIASGGKNTLDEAYDEGGAGSGKDITADNGSVRINGTDGFLVTGTFNSGNTIDTEITGAGTRLFFNPRKAAFRAGTATGNVWDNTNIGNYSVAMGYSPTASNSFAVALGRDASASGASSVALGWDSSASGDGSLAFGYLSDASGSYATAIGRETTSSADYSTAIGYDNEASGISSAAFGYQTTASGLRSFASGNNTNASGSVSTAFGSLNDATGSNSTVFGENNTASGNFSTVFGRFNIAPSGYETVLGLNSTLYSPNSTTGFNGNDRIFAIGNGTTPTNRSNALTIYKNGRMNINDAYDMPLTDGTASQVLTTNGAGSLSWQTPIGDVTQIIAGNGMTGGGIAGAITVNAVGSNGLSTYVNDIRLGGTLTQSTTITNGANNLIINANSTGTFRLQDGGTNKFEMNAFGDAVFGGDVYFRDENSDATSAILGRFIDNGDDGRLQIYENNNVSVDLNANTSFVFNQQGLDRDFRVESDTRPNLFLIDASDDIVRVGTTVTGGIPENGNTRVVNGQNCTVDYVANFEIAAGNANTTIGIGSTEFLFDVGNLYMMIHGRLLPFDDNVRSLGTSNWRWQALWAGDGTINTSDLRQKKNIKPLEYGLEELMQVETLTFNWKKSSNPATKIGFSAQNLLEVLPEVVVIEESVTINEETEEEEMRPVSNLGVYYSDIIPVTVKAIQELNNKIEDLETENASLKAKLNKLEQLEARILALENNNTVNSTKNETASVIKE